MRIAIVLNAAQIAERAFFEIKGVLKAKPDATIGFATGATPLPLYAKMVKDHKENGTSYKKVTAINLDEYVGVDAKDKSSFARYMRDNLFSQIDIDPASTHIPDGMAENLAEECARYSEFVKNHPADIQILGIGANGHIGFNEPYTKYDEPTHIAHLTAKTRADNAAAFKNPSLVPYYALTMGINEILTAKKIVLLASGESKAEALYNMFRAREDTSCPAAALRHHPDVLVIADKEAAALLAIKEWENGESEPAVPDKAAEPVPAEPAAEAPTQMEEAAADVKEEAPEEVVEEAEEPEETVEEAEAEDAAEAGEEPESDEEEQKDYLDLDEDEISDADLIEGSITDDEDIAPFEKERAKKEEAPAAQEEPEYEAEAYEKSDDEVEAEEEDGKKRSRSRKKKK